MNRQFIPLSVPNLKGNELKYVSEAIESEWVSSAGPFVEKFEQEIAAYVQAKGAISCQNGTAGLHVALRVCGVCEGDFVIVPTLTFIAAVNPINYLGADPVFMDCDDSLCVDVMKVKEFLRNECQYQAGVVTHKESGRNVSAIVAVHVFGNMVDMEALIQLADSYNLPVIEDATEALGTYYTSGKYAGMFAGTIGKVGVYSFNGNKIITTGGGGMLVSNDQDLLDHARHLTTQAKLDPVYFIHDEIGYNYRMTNVQAAMGLAQLEQLESFITHKIGLYQRYQSLLKHNKRAELLAFKSSIRPNYWFFSLNLLDASITQKSIIDFMASKNIQIRPVWALIHKQLPYQHAIQYKITTALKYEKAIVNLPCSSNLSIDEVDRVIEMMNQLLDKEE